VVLNAAPLTDVVINVNSSDAGEAVASPATLTFTPANWNVPQSVTVTGVDDFVDDNNQTSIITVSVNASASDNAFVAVANKTVVVTTQDDDTRGITFTPNTGLVVYEGGASDSVAITLNSQPTADVTFGLTNDAPDQVTFSSDSVTFTPANWNVPQIIEITAINNNIAEGGFGIGISPQVTVSADPKYNGFQGSGANGSILDDDVKRVIVQPITQNISESGTSTTFSIVLNSEPTGNVSIPISSDDLTEGNVSVSVLNFTPASWNVPQFVTVTGVDDSIVDGHVRFNITTGIITGTSDYAGINPDDTSVVNLDNDVRTLTVTISPGSISENAGVATGTVSRNDADLSSPWTIGLVSSDATEATVPTTVVIPAGAASATFSISALDDIFVDGTQSVVISASAFSYVGASATLDVTDDEVAGFSIVNGGVLSVSETGTTQTFDVVLNAAPLTDVVVNVNSSDAGEAVASPATLTFTPANWNVPQSVTVTGVDDLVDDEAQFSTITVGINASASNDAFDGLVKSNGRGSDLR
jgi:hypothetical protein